ncbi:hypothetical protein SOASR015_42350 [Pectobacterium carotovorum subsp. carotovorum]|nr:hypothetical protein SOASR015_42350 [Pectobacterium carotovorum subsp. carotovorum]GLX58955.1 hypothetical protein Pcaca02_42640 [Pectobacterium carotovorum subsp. carotovorum]
MSNESENITGLLNEFTKVEIPDVGKIETDNPVVEVAIAASIVGAAAYGIYKLFSNDD